MDDKKEFPPILHIRVTSGAFKDQWLWMISVTKGNVPFTVSDWNGVYRDRQHYKFSPTYIPVKDSAFRPISEEAAKVTIAILKSIGVEAEIVSEPT